MKTWTECLKESNTLIRQDKLNPSSKLSKREEEELNWRAARIYAISVAEDALNRASDKVEGTYVSKVVDTEIITP